MNDPVKCADCGTWWRGDEHRCADAPTPEWVDKLIDAIRASGCGHWHYVPTPVPAPYVSPWVYRPTITVGGTTADPNIYTSWNTTAAQPYAEPSQTIVFTLTAGGN